MPTTLPIGALTTVSFALTGVVIGNAYYQKKQFYPTVVYIIKSNPSLAAIYLLAFTLVVLMGKLLKKLFFGSLRAAEFEQLLERSFYAVTETCLAFTVFRDDFSPKFVSLFTVLLFLKAFHYLTDSRVDFMERSPVITLLFHFRVVVLLSMLMLMDLVLLNHSYMSTIYYGASVQLVFGFEYAILLTVGFNIAVKYICHSIDLRSENPWEAKAVYLLYTELLVGFVKVVLYFIFLFIMICIHTFPLFIIRPMYLTIRSFKNTLNDVIQSRRAIHNMNTLYPNATPEELSTVDNVCIICREEMTTGAKKLPCGHIFHSACLRSWFQRQQTCPTCRMDILQQPVLPSAHDQAPGPHHPPPQRANDPQIPQLQQPRFDLPFAANPFMMFGQNAAAFGQGMRPPFPFPIPFNNNQFQPPQREPHPSPQSSQPSQSTSQPHSTSQPQNPSSSGANFTATSPNPFANIGTGLPFPAMSSFFPPFMPFNIPCPPMPPNFDGFTIEELRLMEGSERSAVEARIRALKDIHLLLDAAAIQLSQYYSVANASSASEKKDLAKNQHSEENLEESGSNIRNTTAKVDPSDSLKNEECSSTSVVSSGAKEDISGEVHEVRRRRLEKFSSTDSDVDRMDEKDEKELQGESGDKEQSSNVE